MGDRHTSFIRSLRIREVRGNKAATEMADHFQTNVFPHLRVGLLHGRLRSVEKQDVMSRFKSREIDILVSTTVIEVGIDVPNATLMVIENAERLDCRKCTSYVGASGVALTILLPSD